MESIDTSSATGRMFIKIVGIFAEFERENLAERVTFGMNKKPAKGTIPTPMACTVMIMWWEMATY